MLRSIILLDLTIFIIGLIAHLSTSSRRIRIAIWTGLSIVYSLLLGWLTWVGVFTSYLYTATIIIDMALLVASYSILASIIVPSVMDRREIILLLAIGFFSIGIIYMFLYSRCLGSEYFKMLNMENDSIIYSFHQHLKHYH